MCSVAGAAAPLGQVETAGAQGLEVVLSQPGHGVPGQDAFAGLGQDELLVPQQRLGETTIP